MYATLKAIKVYSREPILVISYVPFFKLSFNLFFYLKLYVGSGVLGLIIYRFIKYIMAE